MEKVFSLGLVGIFTRVIMSMMKDMEMGKCCGQMEACMKENGEKEYSMELVELFFQMELTRRAISKTTSTNIHFNQGVSKHK